MTTKKGTKIASVFSPFKGETSMQRKSWINRSNKLAGVALAAGMALGLAGTTSEAATIIYQENFDGASDVTLHGVAPAVVLAGEFGIPAGGATWSTRVGTGEDPEYLRADGSVRNPSKTFSAYLPFVPTGGESNSIYTLTVAATFSGGSHLAVGFNNGDAVGTGGGTGNQSIMSWIRFTDGSNLYYGGVRDTDEAFNEDLLSPNITVIGVSHTYAIELDMRKGLDNTDVRFFIDGTEQASIFGMDYSETGNQIQHIQLANQNSGYGQFDSLTLTQIPEPSTALLVGLLGVTLFVRRRRQN